MGQNHLHDHLIDVFLFCFKSDWENWLNSLFGWLNYRNFVIIYKLLILLNIQLKNIY